MELTALKIKIELNTDGSAKYPNFNSLAVVSASGIDWSKYIDTQGLGWHYDKTSGHKEDSVDSPLGQQWGVLIVPEAFTLQAIAAFPTICSRLTEAELTTFHDDKAHAHESDNHRNMGLLDGLHKTLSLMESSGSSAGDITTIKAQIKNAVDPTHIEPGVKKNNNKTWVDRKAVVGVTIKDA